MQQDDGALELALDEPEPASPRRPPSRRSVLVGAATLTAGVAAGVALRRGPLSVVDPPPVDRTGPWLAVEPPVVGTGAGAVAQFVVALQAGTADPQSFAPYELRGGLERWDGHAWQPAGTFTTGLASTRLIGRPVGRGPGPGAGRVVPEVALAAPAGGTGPLELLDVSTLPAGSYRLTRTEKSSGATALGRLDVAPNAPSVPELRPWAPAQRATFSLPAAVPADTLTSVRVAVLPMDALDLGTVRQSLTVERWDGVAWRRVAGVALRPRGDAGPLAYRVDLPALPPGTYRVRGTATWAGELWSPFWVLA